MALPAFSFVDHAVLDDYLRVSQGDDVKQGIALHNDDVRQFAGFDSAQVGAASQDAGVDTSRRADGPHGRHTVVDEELQLTPKVRSTVWESLAVANLMSGLAANRRYTYQSVGALGVIEMTAPGRVSRVNDGLRRLGVSVRARQYFQLHAGLDVRHSEAWNREVIRPLIADDARIARAIAEGALMRLRAGERCFQRYRLELGVSGTLACH